MNKYAHALQHGIPSLIGWLRFHSAQPEFARELLKRRWRYFIRREFVPGFVTPDGFVLQTPDTLIAYWSMFVVRELYCDDWINALRASSQPLVLDVGANAGLFSHLAFCINPRAEIIAFEPLPVMVERINASKLRNKMNLRCVPKAVGRTPGTATLESPHGYDGTSRICTSGKPTGQTFQVEVTTLDQELKGRSVLLIKIDVEGFEEEVIAGAPETLARTKFLIIEAHNAARRDHLTRLLGPGWQRRKLGSSDYLFTRV
jgi:FkbM family methyltransferase